MAVESGWWIFDLQSGWVMKGEYDLAKMKARKNPYAGALGLEGDLAPVGAVLAGEPVVAHDSAGECLNVVSAGDRREKPR